MLEEPFYRPPSEAESHLIRVTRGCAHNACHFCAMYKGISYMELPWEIIRYQIDDSFTKSPRKRHVFLGDGDALHRSTPELLAILTYIKHKYPQCSRISSYATPRDILLKSDEELRTLGKVGLRTIYMGVESGSPTVLKEMHKGVTPKELLKACEKVKNAQLKVSITYIIGLGGKEYQREHIAETVRLFNAMEPDYVNALSLMIYPNTPLSEAIAQKNFTPLSKKEALEEHYEILSRWTPSRLTIYGANHPSNPCPLFGIFPKDRDYFMKSLRATLKSL